MTNDDELTDKEKETLSESLMQELLDKKLIQKEKEIDEVYRSLFSEDK